MKTWALSIVAGFALVAFLIWPRDRTARGADRLAALTTPVYFAFDSDVVGDSDRARLVELSRALQDNRAMLQITGHTDSSGTETYNWGLAERRAVAVANILVSAGLDTERISIEGRGETSPAATPEDNEEAAALNRRVELRVSA